jgi:hypothetical protein
LVRFRLEAIDTGWKVVVSRRVQPGDDKPKPAAPPKSSSLGNDRPSPAESPTGSLGDPAQPPRDVPPPDASKESRSDL